MRAAEDLISSLEDCSSGVDDFAFAIQVSVGGDPDCVQRNAKTSVRHAIPPYRHPRDSTNTSGKAKAAVAKESFLWMKELGCDKRSISSKRNCSD
jgi:hypothetical protein